MDLCGQCYQELELTPASGTNRIGLRDCNGTEHKSSHFLPTSTFCQSQLLADIAKMEMESIPPSSNQQLSHYVECVSPSDRSSHPGFRDIPKYQRHELTDEMFSTMWAACTPFVIQGAMPIMSPDDLLATKKNRMRTISVTHYTADNELAVQEITLEAYFDHWKVPIATGISLQIRVGHKLVETYSSF
jgi:hypothetical protein